MVIEGPPVPFEPRTLKFLPAVDSLSFTDSKPDANFPSYGLVTTQYTGGTVKKYDDLPPQFVANIDTQMPLDGRQAHSAPPMSEQNVADLICFLNTLTDGYQPPASAPTTGPCTQ